MRNAILWGVLGGAVLGGLMFMAYEAFRPEHPKPVKTTTIELPLSEQRLAGVPVPRNRPLDYDPEHVAAVLAWRLEFHREIYCQTHIC